MIRDGDSKAFEIKRYIYTAIFGPDAEVTSQADKNHAAKCVITRVQTIRNNARVDGQTIKGRGKVTESFMKKLSTLFNHAIRVNAKAGGSVEELREAVWAIFYHCSSIDGLFDHT